jgi:hypothetical protein
VGGLPVSFRSPAPDGGVYARRGSPHLAPRVATSEQPDAAASYPLWGWVIAHLHGRNPTAAQLSRIVKVVEAATGQKTDSVSLAPDGTVTVALQQPGGVAVSSRNAFDDGQDAPWPS